MLRVIQNRDARSAKGYYTGKAEAGYYLGSRQELVGSWGGKSCERLGLCGEVERHAFERLCDNRHPESGDRLTLRQKANRTTGYDFNFHACKSASLLYGLTGDPAILRAFREAVAETMADIEARVQTRVRKGGRQEDRTVGNMAWAEFIHLTARPTAGVIDPHLHAHCFVFNAVFDPVERQWKAGQFRELKANAPEFQKAFHARFAWKLMERGYPIERSGTGWEIAGVDRATVEKFSGRTRQVEAFADTHGITDPREKDQLGARTRERKRSDIGMDALRREWLARLTDPERQALTAATTRRCFTPDAFERPRALDALRTARRPFPTAGKQPGLAEYPGGDGRHALAALRQRQRFGHAASGPDSGRQHPP